VWSAGLKINVLAAADQLMFYARSKVWDEVALHCSLIVRFYLFPSCQPVMPSASTSLFNM
jgi:hypothetical protein